MTVSAVLSSGAGSSRRPPTLMSQASPAAVPVSSGNSVSSASSAAGASAVEVPLEGRMLATASHSRISMAMVLGRCRTMVSSST